MTLAISRTIKRNEQGIQCCTDIGFKKELARAKKRGLSSEDFDEVVVMLKNDEPLPPKYKDHKLSGKFRGYRECHINPDWLLVYKKYKDELILILAHTGTHSDLF